MIRKNSTVLVTLIVCLLLGARLSAEATPALKVGNVTASAGSVVELPVYLNTGGASISGFQFDITLPSALTSESVTPNKAFSSSAAGKNVTQRISGRTLTCLVFGLNQNPIESGNVVTIKLRVDPSAAAGLLKLPLSRVVFSDPNGAAVKPGKGADGTVKVTRGNRKT